MTAEPIPQGTCPTCRTALDPARAPVARIVGGRIQSFCSPACASGTPAPSATPDTAAVIPTTAAAKASTSPAAVSALAARPALGGLPRRHADTDGGALVPDPELDHLIGRHVLPPRPARSPSRIRLRIILSCAIVIAGGMAIAIIEAVSPSTPAPAQADEGAANAEAEAARVSAEAAASAAAQARTPEALAARATAVLRAQMASPSSRRAAALALSRSGDAEAIATLQALLPDEPSDLGKLVVAHALARAGDPSGLPVLQAGLAVSHGKRDVLDVRLDAARLLLGLGDTSGVEYLESTLSKRQYLLGAAEILARAGNDKGLEKLREILASETASAEDKLRAAAALGHAGDTSVIPQLKAVLDDGHFNVGAATALAALHDPSATAALIRQLALPSLRVSAALWLRRTDAVVDLSGLADAMDAPGDLARGAAEALLILAGPRAWAERD